MNSPFRDLPAELRRTLAPLLRSLRDTEAGRHIHALQAGCRTPERLAAVLIRYNVNDIVFMGWFQRWLYAQLHELDGKAQLALILHWQEEVRHALLHGIMPVYARYPSVNDYLGSVLGEEYHRALIRSLAFPRENGTAKLPVNLTVAELACLLRLLHSRGVFRCGSVREVLRFVAGNFSSKRQEDFSLGNLSKEYYAVTQVTAAGMRGLLLGMVEQLGKQYFPVIAAAVLLIHTC